jgi:glutamate N-acetyltransferase/amino-acid N-acetyltransferase
MCALVEMATGIAAQDVVVASTGVIGQPLNLDVIAAGYAHARVVSWQQQRRGGAGHHDDGQPLKKKSPSRLKSAGKTCRMGAIAKGSG